MLFNYIAKLLNLTLLNRIFGAIFYFSNLLILLLLVLLFANNIPLFSDSVPFLEDHSTIILETNKLLSKIEIDYTELIKKAKIDQIKEILQEKIDIPLESNE
jgi:hypothetical protein